MKCQCIVAGMARIVGRAKPLWVEPGQIHDVELNEGNTVPGNFVPAEDAPVAAPPKKHGRTKTAKDDVENL